MVIFWFISNLLFRLFHLLLRLFLTSQFLNSVLSSPFLSLSLLIWLYYLFY